MEGLQAIAEKEKIPGWLRDMKWEMLHNLRRKNRQRRPVDFNISLVVIIAAVIFLVLALFWTYFFYSRG